MLFLLALLILGIVWVASALIDNDAASMESLYGTACCSAFIYAAAASVFSLKWGTVTGMAAGGTIDPSDAK